MGHLAEEERLTALRDEAELVWHLEREQEKRNKEEQELTRKRRVAESQKHFKQQVCTSQGFSSKFKFYGNQAGKN